MYTEFGTSYNAYVIKGSEKTVLVETVKLKFFEEYKKKVEEITSFDKIDYLIINHTEPDHSSSITEVLKLNPNIKIIATKPAIMFLKEILNTTFDYIEATENLIISLGNKTINFLIVPFLHWPDSMYTYIKEDNILFSCDSFGAHFAHENIFNDLIDIDYLESYKYYHDMIMGPFPKNVLFALDKIKDLKIDIICNGHGPVLRKNIDYYINLYREWATKNKTTNSIVIPYVSAYGYTEKLAHKIKDGILAFDNSISVKLFDMVCSKKENVLKEISLSKGVLFGSPTLVGDALYPIWELLISLNPIIHKNISFGAFGSFGWSGEAVNNIEQRLKMCRFKIPVAGLKVKFNPNEVDLKKAFDFGHEFASTIKIVNNNVYAKVINSNNRWKCIVCGEIFEQEECPEICDVCGAKKDQFEKLENDIIKEKKDTNKKIVVIGSGVSAINCVDEIRKRDKSCQIDIITEEKEYPYYRTKLTNMIYENYPENQLFLKPKSFYNDNNINFKFNTKVTKIDPENSSIITQKNENIKYDILVLAIGSSNFIPEMYNTNLNGVFNIRTLEDINKIKEYVKDKKNITIVGGGLLGLEAAWNFNRLKKDVTVVEYFQRLLPRQLDTNGSNILLDNILESNTKVCLGATISKIEGNKDINKVIIKYEENVETEIDTDALIVSIGVRANISLAKAANIKTNRGIIVNEFMQTNYENIYAIGDCAEFNENNITIWPIAMEMGRCAGKNIAGEKNEYKGFFASNFLNSFNTTLFSAGEIIDHHNNCFEFINKEKEIYKKILFKNDIIIGCILIKETKDSSFLSNAIAKKLRKEEILKRLGIEV
jgi:flavorubredoxin